MKMARGTKFYRKNEAEIMKRLGLNPVKNSGAGWIDKEDGESEDIICQLKSTDAESIRVYKRDIDILELHALQSHKVPVFAIQFLCDGSVFVMMRPEDIRRVADSLGSESSAESRMELETSKIATVIDEIKAQPKEAIKSGSDARVAYHKEMEKRYKKRR